jgi:hypothetical protein
MLRGRLGLALAAVRDEETAAGSCGVDVHRAKLLVYLVSAVGCGAAGGAIIISSLSVNPDAIFNVQWSAYTIFIVIIGGIGYIEGPLPGAVVLFALQQGLADYGSWYLVILGVIAMLVTRPVSARAVGDRVRPHRIHPVPGRLRRGRAGGDRRLSPGRADGVATPTGRSGMKVPTGRDPRPVRRRPNHGALVWNRQQEVPSSRPGFRGWGGPTEEGCLG